jgi:hypothetical protein
MGAEDVREILWLEIAAFLPPRIPGRFDVGRIIRVGNRLNNLCEKYLKSESAADDLAQND